MKEMCVLAKKDVVIIVMDAMGKDLCQTLC